MDAELLARCRKGERRAFDEVYALYGTRLLRACMALVGNATEAEDLLQQVFTQAFRNLHRFRGESSLVTWLHGIAVRLAANQRRGRARRRRLADAYGREAPSPQSAAPDPQHRAEVSEALVHLDGALERLTEKKRTAFLLHHAEGLDLPEVAAIMGASVQTTFARVKAARIELATLLSTGAPAHAGGET